MTPQANSPAPVAGGGRGRRIAAGILLVVAAVLVFASINALWINRQLLDTDNWTEESSELLERDSIRTAVADFLTEEAYATLDVEGRLSAVLPPRAQPLAAPAAGALRNAFNRGVEDLLRQPKVQTIWEDANRTAHRDLLRILEEDDDDSAALKGRRGEVVLDLGIVLSAAAEALGVGQRIAAKLPPDTAEITILRSDQIEFAQDAFQAFKGLTILLLVLTLACFAAAIAVSPRRREALRGVGFTLIVAGVAGLIEREIAGDQVVGALSSTATVEPAIADVWEISTSHLIEAAEATVAYGLVIVLAAWLAGRTRAAVGARRTLHLGDPRIAYGGLGVLFLLVVAWGPTPATRQPLALLILAVLLMTGMEILRRKAAAEAPLAAGSAGSTRELFERGRSAVSGAAARAGESVSSRRTGGAASADPANVRIDQLERLAQLNAAGVLDADELAAEKKRILGGDGDKNSAA